MPYQKLKKEEMKEVYQMILEEFNLEPGEEKTILASDFKKLGKEAFKRLQKKSKIKDKRKLKRIFEKFQNSNGEIKKLKNSGKISPYLTTEIRICERLAAVPNSQFFKRSFRKLNEQYDLKLPQSNGYLQNFRRRHRECTTTCKFNRLEISVIDSHLSTSCASPLKESYLKEQDYIQDYTFGSSNDSFIPLDLPFSSSEYESEYESCFEQKSFEDFKLENHDDFLSFLLRRRLIVDTTFFRLVAIDSIEIKN